MLLVGGIVTMAQIKLSNTATSSANYGLQFTL